MSDSQFGVYIHIPYCIQRCTYCDFATFVQSEIPAPEKYVSLLKSEIKQKSDLFPQTKLDTLYFGGGTPSLIAAEHIVGLISELNKQGYTTGPNTEITIEINPATVDEKKLELYLKAGVNRFSVGAQSFSDRLLKSVNREHNAEQTAQTLQLLQKYKLNFSFDLLFALPTQTLEELKYDLDVALQTGARHVSPYCLTVPEKHPLSKNRPQDEDQIEMFNMIDRALISKSFSRYEISNYALDGYQSKHNLLYWTDQSYWGLGLSAHSYSAHHANWGARFWNLNTYGLYQTHIESLQERFSFSDFSKDQLELLEKHQSLTDFCHTSLRLDVGLSKTKLRAKFGLDISAIVDRTAQPLINKGLLSFEADNYKLSPAGVLISNQIFEKFTFLGSDLQLKN